MGVLSIFPIFSDPRSVLRFTVLEAHMEAHCPPNWLISPIHIFIPSSALTQSTSRLVHQNAAVFRPENTLRHEPTQAQAQAQPTTTHPHTAQPPTPPPKAIQSRNGHGAVCGSGGRDDCHHVCCSGAVCSHGAASSRCFVPGAATKALSMLPGHRLCAVQRMSGARQAGGWAYALLC